MFIKLITTRFLSLARQIKSTDTEQKRTTSRSGLRTLVMKAFKILHEQLQGRDGARDTKNTAECN